DEAVIAGEPGNRPFDRAMSTGLRYFAREDFVSNPRLALQAFLEKILQAAREVKHRIFGRVLVLDARGVAMPADLDTAEEIGFRARHAEQAMRIELHRLAE